MFKTKQEIIVIQAEAVNPIPTNVVFWSHDHGTAKLIFQLKKEQIFQSLPDGTIVPVCLEFNSATAENGRGKHIYHAVIEDAINGIVSIVLEDNVLGYQGIVDGSIYIELPDSRSLDTAGRFTFAIKRSPIDDSTPELEDYYYQGFEQILSKSKSLIDGVKKDCQTVLDNLTVEVKDLTTQTQAIQQKQADIQEQIDSGKLVTEDDVYLKDETFNKVESSANVIDQVIGKVSNENKVIIDLKGKIVGSAVENPNDAKLTHTQTLLNPNSTDFFTLSQQAYDQQKDLDGVVLTVSNSLNGRFRQNVYSWDILTVTKKIVGDAFFEGLNADTVAKQVAILKKMVNVKTAVWGFGSNYSGNKLSLKIWGNDTSWIGEANHTEATISKLEYDSTLNTNSFISEDGFVYVTAFSEPSDGNTASSLSVDYANLELEFNLSVHEYINNMIAANQVESIATGEEAEAGESNSVFMTPNLVFKAIAKWVQGKFVSTTGNETILGTKNFQDGIQVKGNLPVLTKSVNDYASVDKNNNASVISDGSMKLYRRGDIVYLTGSFKLSAAKYNQAVWFNVPSWAAPIDRPRMYWSSGSNFYLLAFDPSTINNIICIDNVAQDTWLTGSFCWLARDPY
ncbi:BppU family phage baseplate upper protein [Enterococcus avium]|uniref:BppU family phage baseplate upper protein n=3 Tax=Enterococcus avium TaxID=33945 RepID=UPI00288CE373|nr:BppU family phage baseplate upper protein [Enterococcus avium]MDT2485835.1 BppU family phage baseplate upper protein [Enterococcus avium]